MTKFDLIIDESEIEYLNGLDCESMIDDMIEVCDLIDRLNIEDDEIIFDN